MPEQRGFGLVLSRHVGEKIVIGDNIVVTICEICDNGRKVRLGFEAPTDIKIVRKEILEANNGRSRL